MNTLDNLFPSRTLYKGRVTKIYFEDTSSDFYIFQSEELKSGKKIKVKGNFFSPRIYPGAEFEVFEGTWEKSPKYGSTYVITQAGPVKDTKESRIAWVSNSCTSLGRLHASKIVNACESQGMEISDAMKDRSFLEGLDFLGDQKALAVFQEWRSCNAYADSASYLVGLGLPTSQVKSVYETLGVDTLKTVQDNPYALALAPGVSFTLADKIALKSGFTPDAKMRIASILEYMLEVAAQRQGHLYLESAKLRNALERIPSREKVPDFGRRLSTDDLKEALKDRIKKKRIVIDNEKVYLRKNYDLEEKCTSLLKAFDGTSHLGVDTSEFIKDYERIYGISFSPQQEDAIKTLNKEKVLLLTGLPGTGKSTVTKALVRLFEKASLTVTLMAPTGIAAKRLSTVVGAEAGTIHRTLGFTGEDWTYNEHQKFVTDAVVVDESSMIDQDLFYKLLRALEPTTILVLVGDAAQLPSVGAGNVLQELINSEVIPRVHLTEIFRQEGASDIILNAHRINSGQDLILGDPKDKDTDFRFISESSPDRIRNGVLQVIKRLYESGTASSFQVISPTYKGPLGVDRFNEEIKELLNPKTSQLEVTLRKTSFREDDRIMIVKNNYNLNIYNGEIGKLHQIKRKDSLLRLKIFDEPDDRILELPFAQAPSMTTLAYALTVHRCVHPHTLVETNQGVLPIAVIAEEGVVGTSTGAQSYRNKVVNAKDAALTLTTSEGYALTVTPDHGMMIKGEDGVERVEAKDLQQGDLVCLQLGVSCEPQEEVYVDGTALDQDFAELLGMIFKGVSVLEQGKGWVMSTPHDSEIFRYMHLMKKVLDIDTIMISNGNMYESTARHPRCVEIVAALLGITEFPHAILRSTSTIQHIFLKAYLCKTEVHSSNRLDRLELSLQHSWWAPVIQTLLLRLGVVCKIKPYVTGAGKDRTKLQVSFPESMSAYENPDTKLDVHYSPLVSIKPTSCKTMCIEVPEGNEFSQNGMRGSNCQGQEFDYVLMPFHSMFSVQLQRNLLYTAVTRAKKKVFVFGEYKALLKAIKNDSVAKRNTAFAQRLRELFGLDS